MFVYVNIHQQHYQMITLKIGKLVEYRTNEVTANGYKEFKTDQIKSYNWTDIRNSR